MSQRIKSNKFQGEILSISNKRNREESRAQEDGQLANQLENVSRAFTERAKLPKRTMKAIEKLQDGYCKQIDQASRKESSNFSRKLTARDSASQC
jgi:hypothetical protein